MNRAKATIERLLEGTNIKINGDRPWDIRVHDERTYGAVLWGGSLALGETYMAGWWDCDQIDELITRIFRADFVHKFRFTPGNVTLFLSASLGNLVSRSRAFQIGERHYDAGNDLFQGMLDRRMVYTCGYWKEAKTLDEAQEAKLDLVCRKINLKPGQKVLDIGCGWGSFGKFAAEKYGAEVVGVTVSEEQLRLGRELCKGLPVELRLEDYRDVKGSYDHIVSLGMFEHVGYKNYRMYMRIVRDHLKDSGLFLLQTIGGNRSVRHGDPWFNKYIFPNGMIPSVTQIGKATESIFVMEDWHNFGPDYDLTTRAWEENFEKHWPELCQKYSERFRRMWRYYLRSSSGLFRARHLELWQIVFSKKGVPGGYLPVR